MMLSVSYTLLTNNIPWILSIKLPWNFYPVCTAWWGRLYWWTCFATGAYVSNGAVSRRGRPWWWSDPRAFFHDIGHLVGNDAQLCFHGWLWRFISWNYWAEYLRRKGFSEKLVLLVESHVVAKRYLTYKYPEYLRQLSVASQKTLLIQGGVMSDEEAKPLNLIHYLILKYSLEMGWWG